ncbi:HpcH/HpaI aldolase/citrate lyase family protein [uncultured Pelagimonas sp.]|uniref:HpcH/HpaI aldolase/citrate lyase family protein n=1 Tax=uncultured Pelagimonas sp. TaxID=1618102 RepID=UPI00260BD55D|nr:HpcH/HpaI aldolase/citrate lyase family protein [uncultured Pelagimonas sp.]
MQHNLVSDPDIFFRAPQSFNRFSDRQFLRYCLGGTLYMPSTRAVMDKIVARQMPDVLSMVMCFEDAIRAEDLGAGEANVIQQLGYLAEQVRTGALSNDDVPLIFLRVRSTEQFHSFAEKLTPELADILTGFVFPKFYSNNALDYLDLLAELNRKFDTPLYGMPILEGRAIAFRETRNAELTALLGILRDYHQYILNIRVGGTDFSSFFGVRRGIGSSIYDILPVRDALADILNFFGRAEEDYIVSAPVWEYFLAYKRDDLEKVMQIDLNRALRTNTAILNDAIDGLLREVALDKANGFTGKTVIHPSHLRYVNAMQAVTREEYEDACQILDTSGGVIKSTKSNKMNEINPHRSWARRISAMADAYGVVEDERKMLALFRAGLEPQMSAAE